MKFQLFAIILTCLIVPFILAEDLYRSNAIGMTLEKISEYRRDNFEYILEVDTAEPGRIEKTLYQKGEEVKRWIFEELPEGKVESVFEEESLSEVTRYYPDGRLRSILIYGPEGELEEEHIHVYSDGKLDYVSVVNGAGEDLYRIEYEQGKYGRLRKMTRVYPEENAESRYIFGRDRIAAEWHGKSNTGDLFRYGPQQQVKNFEYWREMEKLRETEYSYHNGTREYSVSYDYPDNLTIKKWYDEEGLVVRELKERESALVAETDFNYDERNNVVEKRMWTPGLRERWEYSYNGEDELSSEKYYKNGDLVSEIVYQDDDTYYEYLYRNGERFIKITYMNDMKIEETLLINNRGVDGN